ncbi:aryl-alcohol dehydrogenase (NADP+) [Saccharopolyspora erythraea NRRL 2338]|uniref:Oxidoreductase, aldo/keto reductase family n=2 Tax=Saccharopolyspora erythraea TaxID=1836 RepID=A4F7E5_SACEN|nr:aldo/keto reductase [Saccharopolyspora erythraea]EQD84817.1 NADP-dependent aryl-alcohol dehydrogenase [Saccharopolyspora erythraea D]PFG93771.1 aryl-alcohol dehydrogenase (NADP+) [Saccharopolyspora erythraea NRRL 2338]QRK90608.1 aldo/keto reductase [Saccharopolyspora erythraea]CAL99969.1 oxidoreductase, aldo/keto reductase family [Saccharopolyspora erythraea NRRL 2338]
MARLGDSDLDVFPICLGGNVFGWTADRDRSFEVLDAYVAAGGNFVDTADVYSAFAEGNAGGESEAVLGEWLRARGNRDRIVIATKVGMWDRRPGLGAENIRAAAEDSLRRLGTDHIDLYYAHRDDERTPLEETLAAFDELVRSGKVRHIAASNYTAPRLAEALEVSKREGFARFTALQPHYNLVERAEFEGEPAGLAERENLAVLPYFALAKGFLTGKYRPGDASSESPRAERARAYLDERGVKVLAALDEIATLRDLPVASVALAWLLGKRNVTAPIASARNTEQLSALLPAAESALTDAEVERLDEASA